MKPLEAFAHSRLALVGDALWRDPLLERAPERMTSMIKHVAITLSSNFWTNFIHTHHRR
jgi:hypothetical protein